MTNKTETKNKVIKSDNGLFNMSLQNIPVTTRALFLRLKSEGKVTGTFSAYLRDAAIRQLKNDERNLC